MIIAVSMMALSNPGIQSAFIDVSPSLSNVFYAISNSIATLSGIISPIITGVIRENFNGLTAWRIVFWISFILFCYSGTMFAIFGKTDRIEQLNLQIQTKMDRYSRIGKSIEFGESGQALQAQIDQNNENENENVNENKNSDM